MTENTNRPKPSMSSAPSRLPLTMKAFTWQSGTNPLDLTLQSVDMPALAPGHVLVHNHCIGLNPVDWKVLGRQGERRGKIPGCDGAGIVVAVGPDQSEALIGQRVAYHTHLDRDGSFAEYTSVATRALMTVPDGLDFARAAAMPCPALTAWQAASKLPQRHNPRVLVSGAGGSVGHFLVQLLAERGCRVTTLSHPRHHEKLRALGVEQCLSHVSEVPAATFHAVIDSVGEEVVLALTHGLRANGHLIAIQGRLPEWPSKPFSECWSMHEVALGALHVHGDALDWAELTSTGNDLLTHLKDGRLVTESMVIEAFNALPQLLEALKNRRFSGKAIIKVVSEND